MEPPSFWQRLSTRVAQLPKYAVELYHGTKVGILFSAVNTFLSPGLAIRSTDRELIEFQLEKVKNPYDLQTVLVEFVYNFIVNYINTNRYDEEVDRWFFETIIGLPDAQKLIKAVYLCNAMINKPGIRNFTRDTDYPRLDETMALYIAVHAFSQPSASLTSLVGITDDTINRMITKLGSSSNSEMFAPMNGEHILPFDAPIPNAPKFVFRSRSRSRSRQSRETRKQGSPNRNRKHKQTHKRKQTQRMRPKYFVKGVKLDTKNKIAKA